MELINKEDAVALIKAEMDKRRTHSLVDGTARINLRLAKNIIEDMPTIDIVRCKECRYYAEHNELYINAPTNCVKHSTINHYVVVNADDYCSYGERKSDE